MTALSRRRRSNQAGLTLIELMVTVLLTAILVGGLFYMMSGQQTTYRQQLNATQTNQSLWGTMGYLQRWLRSAGYGFGHCPGGRAQVEDAAGTGTTDSSFIALQVYNHCNLLKTKPENCLPTSDERSDSFTVTAVHASKLATLNQPSVLIAAPMATDSSGLKIPNKAGFKHQFKVGDRALLWDPASGPCILLRLTGVDETNDPAPLTFADSNAAVNFFKVDGYGEATRVVRVAPESLPRHFAVDPDTQRLMTWITDNPNPSADKDNTLEVVADQIEDMQVSWGCDANASGSIDEGVVSGARKNDEWAFNVPADVPPTCGAAPIGAVRVTLIGRSTREVPGATASKIPPIEDEDRATAPFDRYARTVLTTTVKTSNLRGQ